MHIGMLPIHRIQAALCSNVCVILLDDTMYKNENAHTMQHVSPYLLSTRQSE